MLQAGINAEFVTAVVSAAALCGGAIAAGGRLAGRYVEHKIRLAHAEMLAALDDRFVPAKLCEERCRRAEAQRKVLARRLPALKLLEGEEC